MNESRENHYPTNPSPHFPWKPVLLTALVMLALFGLIVLIRRGGGAAMAAVAPAVALGLAQTRRRKSGQHQEPIDMEFLKVQLREGASEKVVVTPTELKLVLNRQFEQCDRHPPFESEQQMAKVLLPLGLHSKVRTVPGRSERRWYDLSGYGTHEAPAQ